MAMGDSLDVFDYLDYRRYFAVAIADAKKQGVVTGLRDVAGYLGLKSPGHITWILQGKRDLAPRLVEVVAKLFRLDVKQSQYLALLLEYNDTVVAEKRPRLFRKLVSLHAQHKKMLGQSSAAYWTNWHHAAIREVIGIKRYSRADAEKIAHLLRPEITSAKVLESLKILERLGMVSTEADGTLVQESPILSTGENWTVEAIRAFQLSILELAGRALLEIPKEQREITTITCSMSEETFHKVKARLMDVRQEILTLVRTDAAPEKVYQLSVQLFPASQSILEAHE